MTTASPDSQQSTVVADSTKVSADGKAVSTITVTLRDSTNQLVAAATSVMLKASTGHSKIAPGDTQDTSNGVAIFKVTDQTAEQVTYAASVAGTEAGQPVSVTFETPQSLPDSSGLHARVECNPPAVAADGMAQSVITLTLLDASDKPVAGKLISIGKSADTSAIWNPASDTTDGDGQVTFKVTDVQAETVEFCFSVVENHAGTELPTKADVTFAQTGKAVSFSALKPAFITACAELMPDLPPLLVGTAVIAVGLLATILYFGDARWAACLWALAALAAGMFAGFLFGVPRAPANASIANTNFEQISDWITKIIVGVTLIQAAKIPGLLADLSKFVGTSLGSNSASGVSPEQSVSMAILATFAFIGFLNAYVVTRNYLQRVFKSNDS